jgi:uroporphyrinogen decarboxylase
MPAPDFAELECVIQGREAPQRVHLVELGIDEEVLRAMAEQRLNMTWIPSPQDRQELYWKQRVMVYHRLGYDCVPAWPTWHHHPPVRQWLTADTAGLSRGDRQWVDEKKGLITSRADFERFPWDAITADPSTCEWVTRHLSPGMKMTVSATLFEHVMENLLGYEGLFYLLYDDPDLVASVFDRWGQIVYRYYESTIGLDSVGAIFHADDLGYKTSLLVSPAVLRRHVFPWLKRYAALAHANGKMFWYHCCGNVYRSGVLKDLIEDVKIDAFHAFQDVILPIAEFQVRYGQQVACLGGVDVDCLARLEETPLRAYIRDILERCTPGGRFALGSGNTVTNYVPLGNYLTMLDESRCWPLPKAGT